ncbi:MAG: ABC transporter substrate-binding protein [Sphingomonadales bacterium]|nr:ABC transporter substrate-binding protein [Sphingomonadales bacterium]MDE2568798.1 ABC transporter substrate-binding protein [Sphingomonadales bacterium]
MVRRLRIMAVLALAALSGGCDAWSRRGTLEIALAGSARAPSETGVRLSAAGRTLRAATVEGLVGFDEQGRVIPALADRWLVADDGEAYIFRLRDGTWPDGSPVNSESAAAALDRAIAALKGTPLGLDLAPIEQVRVMAGRVIEVNLTRPMPDLLTLLAQPELGLTHKGKGWGLLSLAQNGADVTLDPVPPERRGLSPVEGFAGSHRALKVELEGAGRAVDRFNDGFVDAVLGGDVDSLPLAGIGGLTRGNVRLDPVIGLFGLLVANNSGFLADSANREALAMAIDREALIGAFNVGGWQPTTRIVSPDVEDDLGTVGERWTGTTMEQRRAAAAVQVARWAKAGHAAPLLRIAIPGGPGSTKVFDRLKGDFGAIGIAVKRVGMNDPADLQLIDVVARYGRAAWFLDELSCEVGRPVCSHDGDSRMAEARAAADPRQIAALTAEAEAEITAANGYIPLARPMRWSLVRGSVSGFAPNPWGWHPLPPLSVIPR